MRWFTERITIYPKLLLTFLIVLVPLYMLSLQMNYFGSEHVKKEIKNSMQSKVFFYNNQLETEFTKIVNMIKEFSTSEELESLSNSSGILNAYEKREIVLKIQKGLSVIRSSSSYVKNVSVLFPSIQRTVSINEYMNMDEAEF
jgi:two-component system sensor histidine kinase YesM